MFKIFAFTMKTGWLTIGLLMICTLMAQGQKDKKYIKSGNRSFDKGDYKSAEIDYRKATRENPGNGVAQYNLGASLYRQKNREKAAEVLKDANLHDMSRSDQAKVYHNLGNSYLESGKLQESIDAYKNALRLNPNDQDTRYNLAYALSKLKQSQNKGGGQQQQNKDQQKKKDQQQQEQQQQQQQQKQQQQKQEISKSDADRMLEALKNNEKNTLDKLKKKEVKAERVKIEKDW